jgi:hypothetical protein
MSGEKEVVGSKIFLIVLFTINFSTPSTSLLSASAEGCEHVEKLILTINL